MKTAGNYPNGERQLLPQISNEELFNCMCEFGWCIVGIAILRVELASPRFNLIKNELNVLFLFSPSLFVPLVSFGTGAVITSDGRKLRVGGSFFLFMA